MASHFNSMIVRMLICLEISLFLTSTMAMDFSDGVTRSTKRFCGRMLTESLALICDGQYGTIIPTDKRSGMCLFHSLILYNTNEFLYLDIHFIYGFFCSLHFILDESFDDFAFSDQPAASELDIPIQYNKHSYLSKIAPDAAIRSRKRRDWINRRGVYDECCRKPCSVQELKSYCKQKTRKN